MCFSNTQSDVTRSFQWQPCVTGHCWVGDSPAVAMSSDRVLPRGLVNINVHQNSRLLILELMVTFMSLRRNYMVVAILWHGHFRLCICPLKMLTARGTSLLICLMF